MLFAMVETIRSAFAAIIANRFRSLLTVLGIVIGVASIVGVIAITEGLSISMTEQIRSLGSKSLTITSYTSPAQQVRGEQSRLTNQDLEVIQARIRGVASITPILTSDRPRQIRFGSTSAYTLIIGTTHTFQKVQLLYASLGRFLVKSDDDTRRGVAVIGETVRRNLGLPNNPIGEYIEISGEWFKVVGVLKEKGTLLGKDQDDLVVLPYTTLESLQGGRDAANIQIQLTIGDQENVHAVQRQIEALLRSIRGLTAEQTNDFQVQTPEQLNETFDTLIQQTNIVFGGIVAISLLVGGIGIMNIMLVSVTERTREIGICMALGAKQHHILLQFLVEAVTLSLLGGVVGLVLGYLLAFTVAQLSAFPSAGMSYLAAFIALGFAAFIGVVFGILPAAKAARLDPVEALRHNQ